MQWLRSLGLMRWVDSFYFQFNRLRYKKHNQRFLLHHPDFAVPPEYMLFEAYRLDYKAYYQDGKNTAKWLKDLTADLLPAGLLSILEWGCGPARIIRHLPDVFPGAQIYGTDYNSQTIDCCRAHIKGVDFRTNDLYPPLSFDPGIFQLVYALSVLTHLSEENHHKWLDELYRVVSTGGILLLTTQGEAFLPKLSSTEKKEFLEGRLVLRGKVVEGHRTYSAFQPPSYMRSYFSGRWKILRFIAGGQQSWGPEQDTWIVQKML
jgi:SAM-dependent methyltransferase